MSDDSVPWSVAWRRAAYGPDGFYGGRQERAEDHFVTAVQEGDRVARSVVTLAEDRMADLAAEGGRVRVVDCGAGDGTLLRALMEAWPAELHASTDWLGIDVRQRPAGLDPRIDWIAGDVADVAAGIGSMPGLVVAHELLDDIPCDVLEPDEDGRLRVVLVDPSTGAEHLGELVDDPEVLAWCARWWPRREPAARIEVGIARDAVWSGLCGLLTIGLAVAIDYAHVAADRARGEWDGGTLVGYLDGRPVSPRPDGSRNITAHVCLDSCAASVRASDTRLFASKEPDDFWWLVQWMDGAT